MGKRETLQRLTTMARQAEHDRALGMVPRREVLETSSGWQVVEGGAVVETVGAGDAWGSGR